MFIMALFMKHYKAKLVMMNIGDTYTTGPKEGGM